jgi:lipopolysaccharide/colanic/teichoic acid biosynthesis glycosyltransferase
MKVLLIHQAFVSPDQAGGTRHFELARHVVEENHNFTIVASDLSYLTGERIVASNELASEEIHSGVRVIRAHTHSSLHRSFAHRLLSYLSFMITSVYTALRCAEADVVVGTSPPIFQAVSAWFIACIRRRPFLLEIRDLWPDFAIELGILRNRFLIKCSRALERFLYNRATHLLVNSPAYRDYLIGKGVWADRITLIPNGVAPEMFDPDERGAAFRNQNGLEGKFVVTYAGALGMANDIPTILRSADRLRKDQAVHFVLVGDGKEKTALQVQSQQLNLSNVTFIPAVPKSQMPEVLAASDACVATLKNIEMFRTTYPNKVFDYMAAGRPVLLAIDGVIRKVIDDSHGGVFIPPGDDEKLAAAIKYWCEHPDEARAAGRSGRDYVVVHLNRHEQAKMFVQLLKSLTKKRSFYQRVGKRVFDLLVAVTLLIFASPIILILMMLVRFKIGSPVIFRQLRPGFKGRPFAIYKLRTMSDSPDDMNPRPDAERLGPFGRFLRSTSLDELPELVNVLRGEMSLVGPRPLLMQYLPLYTSEQMRRHDARPGITGWAQVNGRNLLSWEEKFDLDLWYIDHESFGLDLKIMALTLGKMLRREGISQPGEVTAKEFRGTN